MVMDFLSETRKLRKKWHNIFKYWNKRTVKPEICIYWKYPLNEGEIKILLDEEELTKFVARRPPQNNG